MDSNEKAELLIKLLSDEKFLACMNDAENDVSKMKALFASKGIELSDEKIEIIIDALSDAKKSMYNGEGISEQELNDISGGTVLSRMAETAIKAIIFTAGAVATTGAIRGVAQATHQNRNDYGQAALEGVRGSMQHMGDVAKGTVGDVKTIINHFIVDRL